MSRPKYSCAPLELSHLFATLRRGLYSCAASRLSCFPFYPRLTPWATFSRRFAAGQGAEKVQTRTSGLKPSIKYGLTAALKALRHPNSEFRSTLRSHGLPLLGILSPLWGFLIFRS